MLLAGLQAGRQLLTRSRSETRGSDVAIEVPVSDPARDRHQIQTLILAVAVLSTALLAVFLVVTLVSWLNQFGFLHFPLGFYLLAQGLLIVIVAAAFWFIRVQERIDLARSESEGLG
jgi:putative solute:sodium symporter small subunit